MWEKNGDRFNMYIGTKLSKKRLNTIIKAIFKNGSESPHIHNYVFMK